VRSADREGALYTVFSCTLYALCNMRRNTSYLNNTLFILVPRVLRDMWCYFGTSRHTACGVGWRHCRLVEFYRDWNFYLET